MAAPRTCDCGYCRKCRQRTQRNERYHAEPEFRRLVLQRSSEYASQRRKVDAEFRAKALATSRRHYAKIREDKPAGIGRPRKACDSCFPWKCRGH